MVVPGAGIGTGVPVGVVGSVGVVGVVGSVGFVVPVAVLVPLLYVHPLSAAAITRIINEIETFFMSPFPWKNSRYGFSRRSVYASKSSAPCFSARPASRARNE